MRERLSPQTLLTATNLQKKIVPSLAILIISLLLCLATNSFAQDAATNRIFVMDDFSGGLSTKLSPMSLPASQGDIVENARLDTEMKSLAKRDKTITAYTNSDNEASTGLFRLYLKDGTKVTLNTHGDAIDKCNDNTGVCTKILSLSVGEHKWEWLTWHNVAIGTDGYNQPVKYDGSSASATYLGAPLATDAGSGAGPNGSYTYKVTCYTSSYNVSLDVPSNPVTVTDNDINLTMIPVCPDSFLGEDIIGRKVYRIENGGSTYKLLSNGTIADNSTVVLTDSDADGALGATLSATQTRKVPLGKHLLVNNNRLWMGNNPASPSRLYYGDDGSMEYFGYMADTQGSFGGYFDIRPDDGDEITFIKNLLGKLTVSKNNTIQKMDTDGDTPSTDWAISDPFSFIGCQAPYSAVNTPLGIVYLGNNGIYSFNGQYSQLISDAVTPEIKDITPSNYANVWGAYFKNSYYMAYTAMSTGSSVNNRVLVFDLLSKAFSKDLLGINVFTVFNSGSDVEALYSGSSSNGKIFAHNETVKELVHKTHSDFAGTWDDMRYIPTTAGGDANSPVLEIAWTKTIDEMTGTIDGAALTANFSGTDGATTYTAETGQAFTFVGTAQINGNKLLLNGSSDYGSFPHSANWDFGSGDFSVQAKIEYLSLSGFQYVFSQGSAGSGNHAWALRTSSEELNFIYSVDGTNTVEVSRAWSPVANTDYVVKVSRIGNDLKIFVDDVQVGVTADVTGVTLHDSTGALNIGVRADGASLFNGYIDEIGIMKGEAPSGIIDRPDTTGSYVSQYLTINAQKFDKLYWNETTPPAGGDVTFALRSGATSSDCATAGWYPVEYTTSTGSDVSSATADTVVQYRISMTAGDIEYSPNIVLLDNFNIRLTYNTVGLSEESTIPLRRRSGWIDFAPGYKKTLKKIYAYYDVPVGATGTINITVENFEGDTDTFAINYQQHPSSYAEYFTGGALLGDLFRIDISESSLNAVKIKKLIFVFDVEPFM